ncbi:unnamed protein product [Gongylonema pulchrum]|uniref:Uncharacterized protein n=1 Tax=Gongylonema pulchrum TaxID=637853 RepID=A0A183EQF4_9BILA|nr:unnamed protein product [Gongylonema pulchrum]
MIAVNGERHHSPSVPENKKPLWSPFVRQRSPEIKNVGMEEKKPTGSPVNSIGSQSDWKRSRPKRGQYRYHHLHAAVEKVYEMSEIWNRRVEGFDFMFPA